MKHIVVWFIIPCLWALQACKNSLPENPEPALSTENVVDTISEKSPEIPDFLVNGKDTLMRVDSYNKNVFWDLKYASTDNFMHRVLYDTLKTVYLQRDVAQRLERIVENTMHEIVGKPF